MSKLDRTPNKEADTPGVRVPPPLVIAGTLMVGLHLDGRLKVWPELMLLTSGFGVLVIVSGLALIAAALGLFRGAETRAEPWRPASALVSSGVYRLSRNPMYLGMLMVYAGIATALQSVTTVLLLLPLFVGIDRLVVRREEAYLQRRFGERYDKYMLEVRRWF